MVISCRNLSAKIYPYTRLTIRRVASASRKPRAIITQKPMALHRQAEVDMVQAGTDQKRWTETNHSSCSFELPPPMFFIQPKPSLQSRASPPLGGLSSPVQRGLRFF